MLVKFWHTSLTFWFFLSYLIATVTFSWQCKVKLYGIIVTAMIFDCVILLGYYCLVFTDRWKENCKIKPELVTYLTSLGTVAIFSVLTVIIVLLSSAHPTKQECCSGKANFTLETNIINGPHVKSVFPALQWSCFNSQYFWKWTNANPMAPLLPSCKLG